MKLTKKEIKKLVAHGIELDVTPKLIEEQCSHWKQSNKFMVPTVRRLVDDGPMWKCQYCGATFPINYVGKDNIEENLQSFIEILNQLQFYSVKLNDSINHGKEIFSSMKKILPDYSKLVQDICNELERNTKHITEYQDNSDDENDGSTDDEYSIMNQLMRSYIIPVLGDESQRNVFIEKARYIIEKYKSFISTPAPFHRMVINNSELLELLAIFGLSEYTITGVLDNLLYEAGYPFEYFILFTYIIAVRNGDHNIMDICEGLYVIIKYQILYLKYWSNVDISESIMSETIERMSNKNKVKSICNIGVIMTDDIRRIISKPKYEHFPLNNNLFIEIWKDINSTLNYLFKRIANSYYDTKEDLDKSK